MSFMLQRALTLLSFVLLFADASRAAELSPKTVAIFDRYVGVAERRIGREVGQPSTFLRADTLTPASKTETLKRLRGGEIIVERLRLDGSQDVPAALLHHWIGIVFIPGARVRDAVALMQDYDHHSSVFAPNVVQSKLLQRRDASFKVFLRFYMKKMIAVTLNTEHEAQFTIVGADRAYSSIHSTRIAEVEDAGMPSEHEQPPGTGHGFMWRLNTYWRFLERDGGTYVQCESITLSRDVPFGLGWLIKPFVTEVPRDSLSFMLERVRHSLVTH
jgi:hypothetical protein